VAVYHAETDFPVVQNLVCDDTPQFNWLSREMILCWVYERRHEKKLIPIVARCWSAYRGWDAGIGYLCQPGCHYKKIGGEFLSLLE